MGRTTPTGSVVAFAFVLALVGGCGDNGAGPSSGSPASSGAAAAPLEFRRISQTEGGFTGELDDHDEFGSAVAGIGDLDGDGIGDLAVGAPWDEDGDTQIARGAVWILFMNPDLTVRSQARIAPGSAGFLESVEDAALFGMALAGPGDLDGDGIPDLTVGAPKDGDRATGRPEGTSGSVWNLLLRRDATVRDWRVLEPDDLDGPDIRDGLADFGTSLAALGDVDGDGAADLAISGQTRWQATADEQRDGITIAFLDSTGGLRAVTPLSALSPGRYDLAAAGDLDGNGVGDLVAAYGQRSLLKLDADGNAEEVVAMEIPDCEESESCRYVLDDPITVLNGFDEGLPVLASLGLFDRSPSTGGALDRALLLWSFDSQGRMHLLRRFSSDEEIFDGRRITAVGDLDGDGRPEVVVPAPRTADGGPGRGAFWLGSLSRLSETTTSTTFDSTTTSSSTSTTCIPDVCDADDQDATLWDVEVHLEDSRAVAALQFRIDYASAAGFFVGSGSRVECDINPDLGAFPAFNDMDGVDRVPAERSLGVAIISIAGFAGPRRLVSCRFQGSRGEPSPEDFGLKLVDSAQPNLRGVNAPLHVVVRPAP